MTVWSPPVSGFPRPSTARSVPLTALATRLGVHVVTSGDDVDARTGDVHVTGVTLASGSVQPGDLYAALPGSRRHGAEFIAQARQAGAVAVLTDHAGATAAAAVGLPALVVDNPRAALGGIAAQIYGDPTSRLPVIGITGTNGKTSTTYLIEAGLRAAGHRTALIGTVETRLGDVRLASERTTPESPELQALLAVALERGVTAAVMEVSSHALALERVTGTRFAVGAFTNFGHEHLDFHGTIDEYFAAKARLFDGRCAHEVVNLRSPQAHGLVKADTITVAAADVAPDRAVTWRAGTVRPEGFDQHVTVTGQDGTRVELTVRIPGAHNVENALVALACLTAVGVDPEVAAAGIASCPGVPGRMEKVTAPGPVLGVVDYAHKPDAVRTVLTALSEITPGRLLCVIGAGGDRDHGKRALMGEAAARYADVVIVTDDNPRTEDPAAIRAAVLRGTAEVPGATVREVADRRAAIIAAVAEAGPGDTIAVLGKGHEQKQEVAGQVLPFDDRMELAAALTARFSDPSLAHDGTEPSDQRSLLHPSTQSGPKQTGACR